MKKIIISIAVIVFLFSFNIKNLNAHTIKMGYIEFPPVFSTGDDGRPHGILIDLAEQVLTNAGYKVAMYSYPVKRMAAYIASGKLDLWIGLKTLPEFEGTTYKGENELLTITLKAYRTKNDLPDIVTKRDLDGKSIIIIRGFSYGGWINYIMDPQNRVRYIDTYSHDAAFRMLNAKRADYLLDYDNPSKRVLKNFPVKNLKSNTVSSFGAYFVVSKKTRDGKNVIKNLEETYMRLKKEGKFH